MLIINHHQYLFAVFQYWKSLPHRFSAGTLRNHRLMREATSNDNKCAKRCCVCAAWPNQNFLNKNSNISFLNVGRLDEQVIDTGRARIPNFRTLEENCKLSKQGCKLKF